MPSPPDRSVRRRAIGRRHSLKIARDTAHQLTLELVEGPVLSVEALRAGLRAHRPGEADALLLVAELVLDAARAIGLPTMLSDKTNVGKGALASAGDLGLTIRQTVLARANEVIE